MKAIITSRREILLEVQGTNVVREIPTLILWVSQPSCFSSGLANKFRYPRFTYLSLGQANHAIVVQQ